MKSNNTKLQLLEKGAALIHLNGFNNTGINDILKAADVPKGSFYFYFKNKEDYGIQIVEFYRNFFESHADRSLNDQNLSKLDQLKKYFNSYRSFFEETGYTLGCPLGNLSQEMADTNDSFRLKLHEIFEDTIMVPLSRAIKGAQDNGEICNNDDSEILAEFVMNCWQGTLIRMKLTKSIKPLELFEKIIFKTVLV